MLGQPERGALTALVHPQRCGDLMSSALLCPHSEAHLSSPPGHEALPGTLEL